MLLKEGQEKVEEWRVHEEEDVGSYLMSFRSHPVKKSFWKKLWSGRETECGVSKNSAIYYDQQFVLVY